MARALAFECQILVLDEPTTALTDAEADHLFDVLRELKRERHDDALCVASAARSVPPVRSHHRAARRRVRRDVTTRDDVTPDDIVRAMVGRDLPHAGPTDVQAATRRGGPARRRCQFGPVARGPHFSDVSLDVRRGEIVGLFGLVGSGRSELLETMFGLHRPPSGEIRSTARPSRFDPPRDAARAGIALVPEERQRQGLLFNLDLRHNLVLPKAHDHAATC